MRDEKFVLNVPTAADGTGSNQYLEHEQLIAQVTGSFTATVTLEGSLDGTNYVAIGSRTTVGLLADLPRVSFVRVVISGYASGQPGVVLRALRSRVLG